MRTQLVLTLLLGCGSEPIDVTFPGEDTPSETCNPATWAWGSELGLGDAETSFRGENADDEATHLGDVGDMDGDGRDDLVVGAPGWSGIATDAGKLYFVPGDTPRGRALPLEGLPAMVSHVERTRLQRASPVGDVDGDGLADVQIGNRFLLRGRSTWWTTDLTTNNNDAQVQGLSEFATEYLGAGPHGDVDGDGLDDWFLEGQHTIYAVSGLSAGQITMPDDAFLDVGQEEDDADKLLPFGDFDGDGLVDVIGQSWWGYETFLVFGTGAPWSGTMESDATVTLDLRGDAEAVGDLDGDGTTDLALSVIVEETASLYLYFGGGSHTGVLDADDADVHISGADAILVDPTNVGDVNGDGLDDLAFLDIVVAGQPMDDLYILFGREHWPATIDLSEVDVYIGHGDLVEGIQLPEMGLRGDLDGDDIADLVLRVPNQRSGELQGAGALLVFRGRSDWPSELEPTDADLTVTGDTAYQGAGSASALADVDGDGCDDLVVSVVSHAQDPSWTGGELFVVYGQEAP